MLRALLFSTVLAGLPGWWASGCEPERPAAEAAAWRLTDLEPVTAGGRFLVSPRFDEAGRLEAAGHGGRGRLRVEPSAGRVQALTMQRPANAVGEDGFAVLFDDGQRSVRWAPYWGEVQVVEGGHANVLQRQDAWGVVVSPAGDRVAWCTGHLPVARLHVETAEGQSLFEGPGAQPVWFPDGVHLAFVVPRAAPDSAGRPVLAGAGLAVLDADSGRVTSLATPGTALPMQPAVSPDATRLVLSDWATGRLLLGRLAETGGAH